MPVAPVPAAQPTPLQLAAMGPSKPVRGTSRPLQLPAPSKGLDAITNLSQMDPASAIYLYNLNPTQFGCRVRPGYQNWCTSVTGSSGVLTLISVRAATQLKLFACTIDGIWDVTSSSSSPTQVVTFPSQTSTAGYGKYIAVTDGSGNPYILYCDSVNGLYYYAVATNTWTKSTIGSGTYQINGADPATFTDVVFYASRVMFVQGGTGTAWYLNVAGGLWGTVAAYYFGSLFPHGGNLNSVYTYTFESVFYLLQYLVTISDAGDVVLWQGTDITSASSWALHGQWYVGDLPAGNRPAAQYGSDLIILSQFGAIALSNLIQGVDINNPSSFITEKIAPALVPLLQSTSTMIGWSITPWPAENVLLINVPAASGTAPQQFVYNQLTKGWAIYQGIPMQCACNWDGVFYSGTSDNRVLQNTGTQDNVATPSTSGTPTAISFSALGAFNALGAPGQKKFIDMIRAFFVSASPVSYVAGAHFDYDISAPSAVVPGLPSISGSWDNVEWDVGIWNGGGLAAQVGLSGTAGIGSTAAFWVVGNATTEATLVGYECMARAGGFL